MTATYKTGDFIVVKSDGLEVQYEIIECSINRIRLVDSLKRIESVRNVSEIDEMVVSGVAVIHHENLNTRELLRADAMDFSSYPEKLKQQARDRFIYVNGVLDAQLLSVSAERIAPVIEEIFNSNIFETLDKKPSARSVQRWIKKYIESNNTIRSLITVNANKGNRNAKVPEVAERYIDLAIEHFKKLEQPSISKSHGYLKTLIEFDNSKIVNSKNKLKVITKTAFIKRLEKEAPKKLMQLRRGKEETNKTFKTAKLPQKISLILQRVESDHTQLDLFIVDSKKKLILGRPYITSILDYKSKCVLGFYIGFEKPSYLSIARALRHSILPKSYIRDLYQDVENEWDCYGVPKVLVVDRGKDFESIALQDACLDLNIRIQRNPAKHPWYKGSIERFFRTVNQELLDDMQGKVFPHIVDTNNYNPEKNAVITMDLFLTVFHKWLIDVYLQDKVSRGKIIPSVSWKEDLDKVPRRVMPRDALDLVLSESASRKNNINGITFEHIQYDSDELAKLRAEIGFRKVDFKYNREDLGQIQVLDLRNTKSKRYFAVPALDQSYAKGLSKHQHQIIRRFNKTYLDGLTVPEALAIAKMKLQELIKSYLESSKINSIATKQKLARWEGVGQQSDQSVKSSIMTSESSTEYQGIPRPDDIKPLSKNKDIRKLSTFDGSNNTLPDELDF